MVLVLLPMACDPAVEVVRPAKVATRPQVSVEPPALPRAHATRCSAQPSTVYGHEEVVFRVEGEGLPNATADVELRDEAARTISKGAMTLPGELRQPGLPSGDFVLIVGSNQASCAVTVNRELQRATQTVR